MILPSCKNTTTSRHDNIGFYPPLWPRFKTWSTYFRLPYCSLSQKYRPSSTFYINLSDLLYTYFWLTTFWLTAQQESFLILTRLHSQSLLWKRLAVSSPPPLQCWCCGLILQTFRPKQTCETNIEGSVSAIMTLIVACVQLPPLLKIGDRGLHS